MPLDAGPVGGLNVIQGILVNDEIVEVNAVPIAQVLPPLQQFQPLSRLLRQRPCSPSFQLLHLRGRRLHLQHLCQSLRKYQRQFLLPSVFLSQPLLLHPSPWLPLPLRSLRNHRRPPHLQQWLRQCLLFLPLPLRSHMRLPQS